MRLRRLWIKVIIGALLLPLAFTALLVSLVRATSAAVMRIWRRIVNDHRPPAM